MFFFFFKFGGHFCITRQRSMTLKSLQFLLVLFFFASTVAVAMGPKAVARTFLKLKLKKKNDDIDALGTSQKVKVNMIVQDLREKPLPQTWIEFMNAFAAFSAFGGTALMWLALIHSRNFLYGWKFSHN